MLEVLQLKDSDLLMATGEEIVILIKAWFKLESNPKRPAPLL